MVRGLIVAVLMAVCTPSLAGRYDVDPDWRAVARAQVLFVAQLQQSADEFEETLSANPDAYIELEAKVKHVLKGTADLETVRFSVFSGNSEDIAAIRDACRSDGRSLIAGLVTNTEGNTPLRYYFEKPWAAPTEFKQNMMINRLKREIARQQKILNGWAPDTTLPYFFEVREIISRMAVPDEQMQAFRDLERLGEPAVPAIIHQMDDRRRLPVQRISLINRSPSAFEAVRHYGPELVVDAIAAILNQITGEYFGPIHNGASDFERDHAVRGWRIYEATIKNLPLPPQQ